MPTDREYRIVDDTIIEQWSEWAGMWDTAYHASGKADAARYVREHTANETSTYTVAGLRRQNGAIGIYESFAVAVEATSVEAARNDVVEAGYAAGYETMIRAIVRTIGAKQRSDELAAAYWKARWAPGGTISDDDGNLVGTSPEAKAIWEQMGPVIEDASRENAAALSRVGVPRSAALTVDHNDIRVTATRLHWTGHFSSGEALDQLVSPPLRDIEAWCTGLRWVWTDGDRLILTYCEGDVSGQVFFTPEAFAEAMADATKFYDAV